MSEVRFRAFSTIFQPEYVEVGEATKVLSQKGGDPTKLDFETMSEQVLRLQRQMEDRLLNFQPSNIFKKYASPQQLKEMATTTRSDTCIVCGDLRKKDVQCEFCAQLACKNCCWRTRVLPNQPDDEPKRCCQNCHSQYVAVMVHADFFKEKQLLLKVIDIGKAKYVQNEAKRTEKQNTIQKQRQIMLESKTKQKVLEKALIVEEQRKKRLIQQLQDTVAQKAEEMKRKEQEKVRENELKKIRDAQELIRKAQEEELRKREEQSLVIAMRETARNNQMERMERERAQQRQREREQQERKAAQKALQYKPQGGDRLNELRGENRERNEVMTIQVSKEQALKKILDDEKFPSSSVSTAGMSQKNKTKQSQSSKRSSDTQLEVGLTTTKSKGSEVPFRVSNGNPNKKSQRSNTSNQPKQTDAIPSSPATPKSPFIDADQVFTKVESQTIIDTPEPGSPVSKQALMDHKKDSIEEIASAQELKQQYTPKMNLFTASPKQGPEATEITNVGTFVTTNQRPHESMEAAAKSLNAKPQYEILSKKMATPGSQSYLPRGSLVGLAGAAPTSLQATNQKSNPNSVRSSMRSSQADRSQRGDGLLLHDTMLGLSPLAPAFRPAVNATNDGNTSKSKITREDILRNSVLSNNGGQQGRSRSNSRVSTTDMLDSVVDVGGRVDDDGGYSVSERENCKCLLM